MSPNFNAHITKINPLNQHYMGGSSNNQVAAVNGRGNIQFGASGSADSLNGKGLHQYVSGGKGMSGGGRSRRHRRSRASKKYARKRSIRHRLKHRKSGKRKRGRGHTKRRGQRGGYAQYLTNQAFTLGQRFPGFPLLPKLSALANPPPFMPYSNCVGGK